MKKISILFLFILQGIVGYSQNTIKFCVVRKALLALSQTPIADSIKTNKDDKIYLIRQFVYDNDGDTIYTGFFNYTMDQNIVIGNDGLYYSRGNLNWLEFDSISFVMETLIMFMHNESMIKNDNMEYFKFTAVYSINADLIESINFESDFNYNSFSSKAKSMNIDEVNSSAKIFSSYLLRNNFGKDIDCN